MRFRPVIIAVAALTLVAGVTPGTAGGALPTRGVGVAATVSVPDYSTDAQGTAGSWLSAISGAVKAFQFVDSCSKNMKQGRSCFDSGELARFNDLRQGLSNLAEQMETNQAATIAALSAIIVNQKDQDVRESFRAVQEEITNINIAMLKYREYNNCLAHISNSAIACSLSDINGLPDKAPLYENPTSVEDLYKDLDLEYRGGPVARFLYATLKTFGRGSDDLAGLLRQKGLMLQHGIAGPKLRVENGLLHSSFELMNARLIAEQGGQPGSRPTFLSTAYLQQMNDYTAYFTDLQASYFASVIAALQLRRPAMPDLAKALERQSLEGVYQEPNIAIGQQVQAFTFPLEDTPSAKQSWFIPRDGNLYRLERRDVRTTVADYGMAAPSFGSLTLLSSALLSNRVKMSTLQERYPQAVPSGDRAAWWAQFGGEVKRFQTHTWIKLGVSGGYQNKNHYSASMAPDYGIWGDNVAVRYNNDCVIPVRMWDTKPSSDDVWKLDFVPDPHGRYNWRTWGWNDTFFDVVKRGDGSKFFRVQPGSQTTYDTVVRTAAVPAFDLTVGHQPQPGKRAFSHSFRQGVGTLYRCGGISDDQYTRPIDSEYMSISKAKAGGLFDRLVSPPAQFSTCKALRFVEWRGIGRPGAVDKARGPAKKRAGYARDNTLYRRSASWYQRNKALDVDKDGIACEITQGRRFPRG